MSSSISSRLHGHTILITGASSGIGRSTALEFARTSPSSLHLILTARRLPALHQLAAQITQEVGNGVKIHVAELDMTDFPTISAFVESLPEEFRGVDCLINNAGVALGGMTPVGSLKESDIETTFTTNFTGLIHLTQLILPILSRPNSPITKTIFNINSIAGHEPYAGGSIYCASKAAVSSFSSALRKELVEKGSRIRVMEVAPGQVETEFSVVRFGGDREAARGVYRGVEPLTPEDVAEVVVWMVGRRENVVVAYCLMFPNHQASATVLHRKS